MKKHFYNLFPSFLIMNSSLFILIFLLHLSSLSTAIVCIPTERDTLLKFKNSLTDPSHSLSSWNASVNPNCCLWHGVVCSNVTSHVLQLHLNTSPPNWHDYGFDDYSLDEEAYHEAYEAYNRTVFGGEINPCLVDLKYLNYLDLSGNYFGSVPIPSFLGRMSSLTHLNLSDAGFMGNIPSQIGNLSNLLQLDLSYAANGTIPSQIANLSNLIYLHLGSNYEDSLVAENIDWLSSLSKLQYLDLSSTSLGGGMPIPTFIGTMTSLSHLDLSDAGFMGQIPYQIGNLSNLLHLDLSYAANGTIPSQIGNLFNLLYLQLRGNSLFAENVDWLSSLSKLQYLDLRSNYLLGGGMPIPTFIGTMTSLSHLDLSYAGFMGQIPYQIGNLSNLVYLELASGSYYERLFAENVDWLSNLSKLEYLDLGGANLSKSIDWLHTLQALPSLKHLDLFECTLPDHYNEPSLLNFSSLLTLHLSYISYSAAISSVPNWILRLNKLISLGLSGNEIQGPIPDGIQNLTLLQNLDLSYNSFSSSIPDWLYSLHHLKVLNLGNNKFHGNISDAMGNLTSLLRLDLSYNKLEGTIPTSLGNLISLAELHLSSNQLGGTIPTSWGILTNGFETFKNILYLDLSNNSIGGTLPKSFGKLSSLRKLILSENQFSGNPFECLRSLSSMSYLDIQDNHFQGVVKEDDLANLASLKYFSASGNNLSLKVNPNWLPTFQLTDLFMSSWHLGPNFPSWIQSQNELKYLDMSNTGILDSIPTWFWVALPSVSSVNLSHNLIQGELGTTLKNAISIDTVDLSSNHLHGRLPGVSDEVEWLDLSSNSFSESMNDFLCDKQIKQFELRVLNLASNKLSGKIPDCWIKWLHLIDVNLQNNHFVGNLPASMGSLASLQSLNVRNSSLSGIFPIILKNNSQLASLDLGENNLSGTIPTWIGERLLSLKVLRLRSNNFSGHIPHDVCNMIFLQDLDLAHNSLSGNIPNCFNHLDAMLLKNESKNSFIYSNAYYTISIMMWVKGIAQEYNNILGLVTNIDLSDNNLSRGIPKEITYLDGLIYLNLSKNQLSGQIPSSIGNMRSLESIDMSGNQLSGEIPPAITNLSFLNKLDLSYNHLEGQIPIGTQIQSFEPCNFFGNNLCGPPLPINCSSNHQIPHTDAVGAENDGNGVNWFFVIMATIGFILGFWAVVAPLFIYRSWRYAYFRFLDDMWYKLQSCW